MKMNLYNLENKYCDQSGFNIKKTIIIFSVVLLVLYGFFNARNLIAGPSFEILSPTTEIETKEKIIEVKGRVKNTSF